jgi:hypothetical protein
LCFDLPVEDFLFSAGGGFLFGAIAGYAIKKVMKVAATVAGLFVPGLAYLSYKGCYFQYCGYCSSRSLDIQSVNGMTLSLFCKQTT